jgi:hypothetical protein
VNHSGKRLFPWERQSPDWREKKNAKKHIPEGRRDKNIEAYIGSGRSVIQKNAEK